MAAKTPAANPTMANNTNPQAPIQPAGGPPAQPPQGQAPPPPQQPLATGTQSTAPAQIPTHPTPPTPLTTPGSQVPINVSKGLNTWMNGIGPLSLSGQAGNPTLGVIQSKPMISTPGMHPQQTVSNPSLAPMPQPIASQSIVPQQPQNQNLQPQNGASMQKVFESLTVIATYLPQLAQSDKVEVLQNEIVAMRSEILVLANEVSKLVALLKSAPIPQGPAYTTPNAGYSQPLYPTMAPQSLTSLDGALAGLKNPAPPSQFIQAQTMHQPQGMMSQQLPAPQVMQDSSTAGFLGL